MKNTLPAIFALALMAGPAQAELIQSTTGVMLTFRHCVKGQTECDNVGPSKASKLGGLPGETEAEASMEDPAFGASHGRVILTGVPGSAKMHARVSSLPGVRSGGTDVFVQRYANTGEHEETLTCIGTLSYDQTVPPENAGFPNADNTRSGAFAEMLVLTMNVDAIEAGETAEDNMAALMGEMPPGVEYAILDEKQVSGQVNATGSGTRDISSTTVIAPGGSVWIMTILQSFGVNGAIVSASLDTAMSVEEHTD